MHAVRWSLRALFLILAAGFGLALIMRAVDVDPSRLTVFFALLETAEPPHFLLLLALIPLGAQLLLRERPAVWLAGIARQTALPRLAAWGERSPNELIAVLAAIALIVAAVGTGIVMHGYPLSQDEFAAEYQAQIFASGHLTSPIPAQFVPFAPALTPIFIGFNAATDTWRSDYLPVYAAMRAVLLRVGADGLLNPLLAGGSIVLVGAIAAMIWPGDRETRIVVALLLVSSAQFLVTAMSAYSMPAHLFLNLLWLWLYLRNTRSSLALTPWVGALALGLHQLNVHALFVAPFLLRLVRERRWRVSAYFGAVYLLALVFWGAWQFTQLPNTAEIVAAVFSLPGPFQLMIQLGSLAMLISWQSLPLTVLCMVALIQWRRLPAVGRDLAASLVLTLAFYVFFNLDQGNGWGYRYSHAVLGNIVLLAGYGWRSMRASLPQPRPQAFLGAGLAAFWLIQFPLRCVQVESFVRPFWQAETTLRTEPADFVVVDGWAAWRAQDLIRNDPWLQNSPKILEGRDLTTEQAGQLAELGSVRLVGTAELMGWGLRSGGP